LPVGQVTFWQLVVMGGAGTVMPFGSTTAARAAALVNPATAAVAANK
jgi:hypothetical protein